MEVIKLCLELGIEDFKDLARFKAENQGIGEDLVSCLKRYRESLGSDFRVK